MNARTHYDRTHELHGKTIETPETLDAAAENIIVKQDGSATYLGRAAVTNEVGVFHGDAATILDYVAERDLRLVEANDFTENREELADRVESGEHYL